ncbi:serine protein kinase RIO [Candidatus Woesearchaeota archaeon]|nr:serine protein kinase RIO [Candidatus Woesearchaeota archaeon]
MPTKEKFKTYKNVFDEKTLRVLFKLESEGYFEELKSPISIGKESNVFTAIKKDGTYVVVKIYRINTADFKRMYKYIGCDPRFKGLSNQRRKVVFAWAQREYRNLLIANQAGARVPVPYAVMDNILVMELIGKNNEPAPRLKDKPPKNVKKFIKELINNLTIFYKSGFIHGDLSEFNILNYNDTPYIIDLSHGVKLDYSGMQELLDRDIKNLKKYFSKLGLDVDIENILKNLKR